jgi:hypothetical protein
LVKAAASPKGAAAFSVFVTIGTMSAEDYREFLK